MSDDQSSLGCTLLLAAAIGFGSFYTVAGVRNGKIKNNLEDNAIKCNWVYNAQFNTKATMPILKNKDIDGDGTYESILMYHDYVRDRIMYQQVTIGENEQFKFGAPTAYVKK